MSKRNTRVSFDKAGTSGFNPKASSTRICPGSTGAKICNPSKKKLSIPALSIPIKAPPLDPVLEKLKKRTIRRNAPQGEDMKKIREIIKSVNKEVVTVQEFVGLVSPYTGDNGNNLRSVMGDDLSSFRRMAKRVYDTMTQDVSDVLANEQIHLTDYYNERYTLFMDKMMRTIDEIYKYVPEFDFERYYTDPDYLKCLFPIGIITSSDPEEREMHRRQEAYHRLQWLRSEGTRLNEENSKLQARLKELKTQQREDLLAAREQEEVAEMRKTQLEAAEADLQNQLQELNESVEKTLILTEEEMRLSGDTKLAARAAAKQARKLANPPKAPKEQWNVATAKTIEEEVLKATVDSAISSVSLTSTASKGAVKKKRPARPRIKKIAMPKDPRDVSPFHYSPIKTPPPEERKETSPFHYSPNKVYDSDGTVPKTRRVEHTTTVVEPDEPPRPPAEQAPPTRQAPCAPCRRNLAPRDTWGGFT